MEQAEDDGAPEFHSLRVEPQQRNSCQQGRREGFVKPEGRDYPPQRYNRILRTTPTDT